MLRMFPGAESMIYEFCLKDLQSLTSDALSLQVRAVVIPKCYQLYKNDFQLSVVAAGLDGIGLDGALVQNEWSSPDIESVGSGQGGGGNCEQHESNPTI